MKKFPMLVFALIIAFAVFSGCSESEEPGTVIPEVIWDYDPFEHWQNGENGEKLNAAEHEMGEDFLCKICSCRINDLGGGSYSINGYDENGNTVSFKEYQNGNLLSESELTADEEGNFITTHFVLYDPDGSKIVIRYNENGDILEEKGYSPDGSLYFENINEYALSDEGFSLLKSSLYTDYTEKLKFESVYNEHNDCIIYTTYGLSGIKISSLESEYEYDEEGRKIYGKTTEYKRLKNEYFFDYYEDENGTQSYCCKEIYYNEMGGHTVFEYNQNGEVLSETCYDPYGNKVS
ncbi:MAG: hypothetical protein IKJ82_03530 [Oscillospiraceae bacterium]|nr:hypothetical protein [Oscillospiraceae bacterium]